MSLTSGLTWVVFGHAFETDGLLAWMALHPEIDREDIQRLLSNEWRILADAACDGSITIRARERCGYREVELGVDELRNFQFISLGVPNRPFLQLERFDFLFAEAFKGAALGLHDGFLNPVIARAGLVTYKRSRAQRSRSGWHDLSYKMAKSWLDNRLDQEERKSGLKWPCVEEMRSRFGLPIREAEGVWTCVAKAKCWPLRGRPKKSQKENSPSQ